MASWTPTINVIVNVDASTLALLEGIDSKLDTLLSKESTMVTKADFQAAHDDIIAKLGVIQQKISGGGMTADEEAAAFALMQDVQTQVTNIASPPAPPATDTPAPTT